MKYLHAHNIPSGCCPRDRGGAALVVVLAFVVLLTGLIVAYFSRVMSERQISNSSANQTRTELFAEGAMNTTIDDLKQEIAAGSIATTVIAGTNSTTIFMPSGTAAAMPSLALTGTTGIGSGSFAPNLLKRSACNQPLFSGTTYNVANNAVTLSSTSTVTYTVPDRAANISTTVPSKNGRSIKPERWNKPMLLPKLNASSDTDLTPVSTGTNVFVPPDWIMVARDGSNPTAWNDNMVYTPVGTTSVTGRYAYVIYNEGGLLDMNVAGYPSAMASSQLCYKNALAFADLTQLTDSSGAQVLTQQQIDAIVGWRNYSTAQPDGTFPAYTFSSGTNYYNYVVSNTKGFLTVGGHALFSGQSDRMFSSRRQLINLLTQGIPSTSADRASLQNALQYLGTFSRELNAPSWGPALNATSLDTVHGVSSGTTASGTYLYNYRDNRDNATAVNRFLPNVRATATTKITGYHGDGSSYTYTINAGAPLVQRRFSLTRLAWVTYKGPSALLSSSDPEYNAGGTAANIQAYFGLLWNSLKTRWDYVGPTGSTVQATIATMDTVASQNREPNFMELLQAGILQGSLGLTSSISSDIYQDDSFDTGISPKAPPRFGNPANQVIQIAANLIDQYDSDSYPTRICFGKDYNGSLNQEFYGSENIPLINKEVFTAYRPQANPRSIMAWMEFEMWSPYSTLANSGTGNQPATFRITQTPGPVKANGTTQYLGPGTFRMLFDLNKADTGTTDPDMRQGYTSPAAVPNTSITVSLSNSGTAAQDPQLLDALRQNGATVTASGSECIYSDGAASYTGIYAGSYDLDNGPSVPLPASGDYVQIDPPNTGKQDQPFSLRPNFSGVVNYELDYDYGGGNFLPVQTISNPNGGTQNAFPPAESGPRATSTAVAANFTTANIRDEAWATEDPRTLRFGCGGYGRRSTISGIDGTIANPDFTPFWGKTIMWDATNTKSQYWRGPVPNISTTGTVANFWPSPFNLHCATYRYADNQGTGAQSVTLPALGVAVITDPFYTDPDGVQRYGDAIWNPASTSKGVFPTQPYGSDLQDRPVILNRPFNSVGEMRYAFRDLPFKSLDFSTARSGDAGLLDLFCIQDGNDAGDLMAGKVDLNTRNAGVIKAIVAGAARMADGSSQINGTDAAIIANDLTNLTISGTSLLNKADLATSLGPVITADPNLTDVIKARKEAAISALATVGQTRTWNLMIDIIAQTGRYPQTGASSLGDFIVEGEHRYWLHVAIDRYTGKIIDQQLESVTN